MSYEDTRDLVRNAARELNINPAMAEEFMLAGYREAIKNCLEAVDTVKIDSVVAGEKTTDGAYERGKAVSRRLVRDRIRSLRKKLS